MALLGYTPKPDISVSPLLLDSDQVLSGQTLAFMFEIDSLANETQNLVVDFAIHWVKASGKTSPKVYKLKSMELGAGKHERIVKRHSFKPISTRTYYEGEHQIEILINGESYGSKSFMFYP